MRALGARGDTTAAGAMCSASCLLGSWGGGFDRCPGASVRASCLAAVSVEGGARRPTLTVSRTVGTIAMPALLGIRHGHRLTVGVPVVLVLLVLAMPVFYRKPINLEFLADVSA